MGDHPEADAVALADLDGAVDLLQPLAGLLLHLPFDAVDQLLGLLVVAVDEQPAGALGEPEGEPSAQVGREQVRVQQQQRQGGPEHGPRARTSC